MSRQINENRSSDLTDIDRIDQSVEIDDTFLSFID